MRAPASRLAPLLLTACAAVAVSCRRTPPQTPVAALPASAPQESSRPIVAPPPQQADLPHGKATVYHVVSDSEGARLEPRTVSAGAETAAPEDTAMAAIRAMAAQESSPLPRGTRALSVVFAGDLATVDLSREFKDNFAGGDENEALAINAILATLGQFPGVRQVQILVEGARIDSLGGMQSLDRPLQVPQEPVAPRKAASR